MLHSHPSTLPTPPDMDDRPSLEDQHVVQLLPSFLRPVSHKPRAPRMDMRVVSIMRSEICMWCREMLLVMYQRCEGGELMRRSRMLIKYCVSARKSCHTEPSITHCKHPSLGLRTNNGRASAQRHCMFGSHLDIPARKSVQGSSSSIRRCTYVCENTV
jgi:hypothetical protein